ncbi:MAG: hypothetical protein JWP26_2855 [Devosia sp.]|uniref:hypothetical protein n=1 Tax=Devosia sp. TaxID=1871048 RepID=UPI00262599A2|nr:hypothetical protein [Devosia sp.]MDB5587885.1 hypothetical protein [Devosia sp.]
MRKFLVPAAIAIVLGTSGLAMAATAAPQSITSTVKTFDAKTHTLTLANNIAYLVPATFMTPLKAGQKVTVKWEMNGKAYKADSVVIN